jgi:DNA-binding NarL/FixJ family response regulator/anti-sigma regulatory factor (Ser/Thr protein kinase)
MNRLLLDSPLAPGQREMAETAHTAGRALLSLVDNVLDLSRIEAGRMQPMPVEFDAVTLLAEARDIAAVQAKEKGLRVSLEAAPDLAAPLSGDVRWLRQILLNLLGNAVKFTERGEVILRASATPGAGGVLLRVEVQDTGPGIAPEEHARIFERFTQIDETATRRHGGSGLGLSISKQLVELQGGRIGVESAAGRGSIFWFEVPLGIAERAGEAGALRPAEAAERRPQAVAPAAVRPGTRLNVLVADDIAVNRIVVRRILEQAGHAVETVDDGNDALDALAEGRFDVALLDINMPGGGLAAARDITLSCPATRVVMLTVSEDEEDVLAAMKAGASGYVLKGSSASELAGVLRSVCAGDVYVAPGLAWGLLREMSRPRSTPLDELTTREREVLELVAQGLSNQEIGDRLSLAEKTIKHYMTNILGKLQVRSRVEAALLAYREGIAAAPGGEG